MNNKASLPIIAFALLSAGLPLHAGESWLDRCVAIIDGDTIVVARGTERVEVDVEGADCPELGQPFGDAAKRFTASMVCRKIVKVQVHGGGDGHVFGRVTVFGKDLSLELVKSGLAWHDHRESQDPALAKAEHEARQADRELWSDQNPIAPWIWRLGHREPAHPRDGCL